MNHGKFKKLNNSAFIFANWKKLQQFSWHIPYLRMCSYILLLRLFRAAKEMDMGEKNYSNATTYTKNVLKKNRPLADIWLR